MNIRSYRKSLLMISLLHLRKYCKSGLMLRDDKRSSDKETLNERESTSPGVLCEVFFWKLNSVIQETFFYRIFYRSNIMQLIHDDRINQTDWRWSREKKYALEQGVLFLSNSVGETSLPVLTTRIFQARFAVTIRYYILEQKSNTSRVFSRHKVQLLHRAIEIKRENRYEKFSLSKDSNSQVVRIFV